MTLGPLAFLGGYPKPLCIAFKINRSYTTASIKDNLHLLSLGTHIHSPPILHIEEVFQLFFEIFAILAIALRIIVHISCVVYNGIYVRGNIPV